MNTKDWLTILIPAIISLFGFSITYFSLSKSFVAELKKQKSSIALEKMTTIPFEVLSLIDKMQNINPNGKDVFNDFKTLLNTIYSYGSEDAINLISLMQKENYAIAQEKSCANPKRMMASYVLLATQIKYDVTGIDVSPELWYIMRITDYGDKKQEFIEANNQLVMELRLNEKFIIK